MLDESADLIVGLRVCRAFAEDNHRTLGALENIERAFDRIWRRDLRWRGVDNLDQRLLSRFRVHHLTKKLGRQIEIDAARTARYGGTNRARNADADILRMQHAERRLAERLGDGKLVHLFVIALL